MGPTVPMPKYTYTKEMLARVFNGVDMESDHPVNQLLNSIKEHLPELRELREGQKNIDDLFYRFYHYSFKVYRVQAHTEDMVDMFKKVYDRDLNEFFLQIVEEGTGKNHELDHNDEWMKHTRPMVEAFFHARRFLDMMIACGERMEVARSLLPSDWAAVLYLYRMR